MLLTPTQEQVTVDRQQALIAAVLRDRLISTALQPSRRATPRPVDRIRAGLRQAVASVVTLIALW